MTIQKITTPGFGCTQFGLASVARTASVLLCETDNHVIERLIIEFENEEMAVRFQRKMEANEAEIQIDEDTSIKAAPRRLQNQYFRCLLKGDVERLHELLDILWEDFGITPGHEQIRETTGVRRLAIMHSHGVEAFGMRGMGRSLRAWMKFHGFPNRGGNLTFF